MRRDSFWRDAVAIASLAESTIEGDTPTSNLPAIQALARRYAADTGARVVITGKTGVALVDTAPTAPGRRTFATRPEFRAALRGAGFHAKLPGPAKLCRITPSWAVSRETGEDNGCGARPIYSSGLITSPQSWAQTRRFTHTCPVLRFTSTSAISATTVWLRKLYAMPRPVRMLLEVTGLGEGRGSQP